MINKKLRKGIKFVVGIDEVGRGPLAGPVAVCAFMMPVGFNTKSFGKIKDSKKLKPLEREEIFCKLQKLKKDKKVNFVVFFESSKTIDKIGIVDAIKRALSKSIEKLTNSYLSSSPACPACAGRAGRRRRGSKGSEMDSCLRRNDKDKYMILLDGGLKASEKYKNQKTIIKGDEKERVIAFASIVAKVTRDALMCRLAKKYPKYCFEIHKGYGTKAHCRALRKNGLSKEHRRSFCKNFKF